MKRLKDWAYRLGVFLVDWSGGPTGDLRLALLPVKRHRYEAALDQAALRGWTKEQLGDQLVNHFIRECEEEFYSLDTKNLFPNHKK